MVFIQHESNSRYCIMHVKMPLKLRSLAQYLFLVCTVGVYVITFSVVYGEEREYFKPASVLLVPSLASPEIF